MSITGVYSLPEGLCWSTDKPTNTFQNREDGCLKLTGTPCSAPGQYYPNVIITIYTTSLGIPFTNSIVGAIILRVVNDGEVVPAFDTTGLYKDSIPTFIPYGPAASCFSANITEAGNNSNVSVKAFPNPFNDITHIVVTGINEKFSFEMYDVTGRLQQSIPAVDNNQFEVRRGLLAKGVYLYRIIVTGKPAAYGKLVIE
jgi:hypothetical protein